MLRNVNLATAAILLTVSCVYAAAPKASPDGRAATQATQTATWREDYAYSMGVAAMHYAYPYLRMAYVRYNWTMADNKHPEVQPSNSLNQFWHASRLADASWTEGGTPNNDTMYSVAMLHVEEEPYILSVPPIDRFYSFMLVGMNSDSFAYVSELQSGRTGGDYALLPIGWKGELPEGIESLGEVPSPWVLVGGRTYVAGPDDVETVRQLQKQYRVTPLSQWGESSVVPPGADVFNPMAYGADPLAAWKVINRMMTENPPQGEEAQIVNLFREINVGPGMDVDALDEPAKKSLARAAKDALEQIKQAKAVGAGEQILHSNGWVYSTAAGNPGANGDFFYRTVHQSYAGIVGNIPEEALYYGSFHGSDGKPLSGQKRYRISIPAGQEPDVGAFWSITLYGSDSNLVANQIDRYSIGDRTEGLVRNEDGSLMIAIQSDKPTEPNVNWLPAPAGNFYLVLRAYQPGSELLEERYAVPPVKVYQ